MAAQINPTENLNQIAVLGTNHLEQVIAIDSQSDETSESIPSTPGQKELSQYLRDFFESLGFQSTQDESANLLVEIPGNISAQKPNSAPRQMGQCPKLVLMVHMDTARGTKNVTALDRLTGWDGQKIPYRNNDAIQVSAKNYPETASYLGQDLLYGPGDAPIGLDDKLGMSELMTLAELLAKNPTIPHGDLVLAFRPDEEIGRMEAVVGLAETLRQKNVTHGYTIDGISPFEVNTENFNASAAQVVIAQEPLELEPLLENWCLDLQILGAKSHGATAKAEGYLNPTRIFVEALAPISRRNDIIPIGFQSDPDSETDAVLQFLLRGDSMEDIQRAKRVLLDRFSEYMTPHAWKGAHIKELGMERAPSDSTHQQGAMLLFAHLATFMRLDGPSPLFSEESEAYEGYTNPFYVDHNDGQMVLSYRIRDFDPDGLANREAHVQEVVQQSPGNLQFQLTPQYVNMGPRLAPHPELVQWAVNAATKVGVQSIRQPIRGGTGVDPFIDAGIPIANLGTGYFAPESEKEFTSTQNIAQHVLWLVSLVQQVSSETETLTA
jgi:di/tripeptidase